MWSKAVNLGVRVQGFSGVEDADVLHVLVDVQRFELKPRIFKVGVRLAIGCKEVIRVVEAIGEDGALVGKRRSGPRVGCFAYADAPIRVVKPSQGGPELLDAVKQNGDCGMSTRIKGDFLVHVPLHFLDAVDHTLHASRTKLDKIACPPPTFLQKEKM